MSDEQQHRQPQEQMTTTTKDDDEEDEDLAVLEAWAERQQKRGEGRRREEEDDEERKERRKQRQKRLRELTANKSADNDNESQSPSSPVNKKHQQAVRSRDEANLPPEDDGKKESDDGVYNKNDDDDDNDSFDMFSSSVSPPPPVVADNQTANNNTMTKNRQSDDAHGDAAAHTTNQRQHQQDWDDSEGYYKAVIGETIIANVMTNSNNNSEIESSNVSNSDIRFRVSGVIGKGVFSTVLKCHVLSNSSSIDFGSSTTVALKCIRHNDTMAKAAIVEMEILQKLKGSPGIVQLLLPQSKHSIMEYRGHTILVFEYMDYNLRDVLQKFGGNSVGLSLLAVRSYFGQLLAALTHLHKHRIVHGDLKPDNILVRGESMAHIALADFGSATFQEQNVHNIPTPYLVSRYYRAPEIILGLLPLTSAMDLWSLAVSVAELFLGTVLFRGRSNNDMLHKIMQHLGNFPNRIVRQHVVQVQKYGIPQHFQRQPDKSLVFLQQTVDSVTQQAICKPILLTHGSSKSIMTTPLEQRLMQAKSETDARKMVQQFSHLLHDCLHLDPTRRIALKEALKHDFFHTPTSS